MNSCRKSQQMKHGKSFRELTAGLKAYWKSTWTKQTGTMYQRTPSFFVKEGKNQEFEGLFNKYYGQYFELLTKEQAFDIKLFGDGIPANGVSEVVGDYIAIAKDKYGLLASKELKFLDAFKGHHAGGTKEERLIDIHIFNN